MPPPVAPLPFSAMVVSGDVQLARRRSAAKETPALLAALNRRIVLSSMWSVPLLTKRTPLLGGLTPKMSRPRRKVDVGRGRHVDGDAVAAGERAALGIGAGDGHRLDDRHGAEAARIEAVDLAARGGLRDRAGEGLARRGAAARIDVVADARNPGASRLRGRRSRKARGHADRSERHHQNTISHHVIPRSDLNEHEMNITKRMYLLLHFIRKMISRYKDLDGALPVHRSIRSARIALIPPRATHPEATRG